MSKTISERQARVIQNAYDANESARRAHDPKRYKRGGSYSKTTRAAIDKMAGVKSPSNRARGKLEFYRFMRDKPEHVFAYYTDDFRTVTTWMGQKLGDIVWKGAITRPMGGKMQAIRVRGVNGCMYAGRANLSSGTYVRLKKTASGKGRSGASARRRYTRKG